MISFLWQNECIYEPTNSLILLWLLEWQVILMSSKNSISYSRRYIDKEALGYILSNLFANEIVNIQITNDDITTRKGCSPSNIK